MSSFLADKSSKVLVLEASGSTRQMMVDTIRNALGYEQVEGMGSVSDAIKYLEIEKAHWIVSSLFSDQPANAMHLLRLCTEHSELKNVRMSLFVSDDEQFVLPTAFSYGLLSYHTKPFTKESFQDAMKKLLEILEKDGFNETLTSARYLREMLKVQSLYSMQLELEKNLLTIFPGNPHILLQMVEPQFRIGNQDSAKALLHQVKILDESLAGEVSSLSSSLFGVPITKKNDEASKENILGLQNCVVIDPDEAVRKEIIDIFKNLGVTDVKDFSDGESAWAHLKEASEPDLLIMEWRIPKISGPFLLQRIRKHGFLTTPVLINSSLIKSEDLPLVREMGIANLIQKPISRSEFIPTLIKTIRQERVPTEHQVLERKLRQYIQAGKTEEAAPLLNQFLGDPNVPLARKRLIEAERAFAQGNYLLTRDTAIHALKLAGDSLFVLNLLGKAFMHLKDHGAALKCFKRAQELSPNNIERLCNIAESQAELGDQAAAKDTLENAKHLDSKAEAVQEAKAKVAMATGDVRSAKEIMADLEQIASLVSYMNNKAVAYSKCGYTQEAVEIYQKTISSLSEKDTQTRAIVSYNLSLCFIKMDELEKACTELLKLADIESRVQKKSASLAQRIKKNLAEGKAFKLRTSELTENNSKASMSPNPGTPSDGETPTLGHTSSDTQDKPSDEATLATEQDYRDMLAAVELKKGDLCCFLIFHSQDIPDPKSSTLMAKLPRYQRRDVIEKPSLGTTHGEKKSA